MKVKKKGEEVEGSIQAQMLLSLLSESSIQAQTLPDADAERSIQAQMLLSLLSEGSIRAQTLLSSLSSRCNILYFVHLLLWLVTIMPTNITNG